jgi:hypothetical protein
MESKRRFIHNYLKTIPRPPKIKNEFFFWTIFEQKSGQLQKIISRKQKIWHLQNFNHGFLTYQSVFLQNFKKIKNNTHTYFWT